ncbi:MAG: hypothetical protein ACP5FH_11360 [Terracidiphilus sp.]
MSERHAACSQKERDDCQRFRPTTTEPRHRASCSWQIQEKQTPLLATETSGSLWRRVRKAATAFENLFRPRENDLPAQACAEFAASTAGRSADFPCRPKNVRFQTFSPHKSEVASDFSPQKVN